MPLSRGDALGRQRHRGVSQATPPASSGPEPPGHKAGGPRLQEGSLETASLLRCCLCWGLLGFISSHWLQAKEEPEGPSHCSEGGPPDELRGPAELPRLPTGAALVPPGGPVRSAPCPPPRPPKAAWSRIAEAAALERTPSREQTRATGRGETRWGR